jgi:hypothetical protein
MQTISLLEGAVEIGRSGKADKSHFHHLHNNAKSPTSNLDGGVIGEIVFKDLIHFDQSAKPVMISQ